MIYGALAISCFKTAIRFVVEAAAAPTGMTSKLMNLPAGRLLVGLVGVGVAGGRRLPGPPRLEGEVPLQARRRRARPARTAAPTSCSARSATSPRASRSRWSASSSSTPRSPTTPQKSGGLDQALHKILQQPFGGPILLVSRSASRATACSASPGPVTLTADAGFDTERLVVAQLDICRRPPRSSTSTAGGRSHAGSAPAPGRWRPSTRRRPGSPAGPSCNLVLRGRGPVGRAAPRGRPGDRHRAAGGRCPAATASSRSAGTSTPRPGGRATPPRRRAERVRWGFDARPRRGQRRRAPGQRAVAGGLRAGSRWRRSACTSRYYDTEFELFRVRRAGTPERDGLAGPDSLRGMPRWVEFLRRTPCLVLLVVQLAGVVLYPFMEDDVRRAGGVRAVRAARARAGGAHAAGHPVPDLGRAPGRGAVGGAAASCRPSPATPRLFVWSAVFEMLLYLYAALSMLAYMLDDERGDHRRAVRDPRGVHPAGLGVRLPLRRRPGASTPVVSTPTARAPGPGWNCSSSPSPRSPARVSRTSPRSRGTRAAWS